MKNIIISISLAVLSITNSFAQEQVNAVSLKDSITSLMKEKHIPGAFVTVLTKDSILFQEGFGIANRQTNSKTTVTTLFKIGSVSKTFTALAIMKMVEDGTLSLDDNLKDIAPEVPFKNKWSDTHPVKLKHLLEHKAGFDDMPISAIAKDRTHSMTAFDEVMCHKKALKSRWKPGLGHSYSNPGYVILGYLIEKFSKKPYQEYISTEVLMPLGMDATHFRSDLPTSLDAPLYAQGYRHLNDSIVKTKDAKIIGEAAGAIASNARDMSHFLQFMLNERLQDSLKILSPTTIQEMESLHGDLEIKHAINKGYGLGVYTRSFGSKEVPFYGHSGGVHGFSSDYIYNRELNIGFAISNNGERGNRDILDYLVDTFVPDYNPPAFKENEDISKFEAWNGTYAILTKRNQTFDFIQYPVETLQLEVKSDSLYIARFMQDKVGYSYNKGIAFAKADSHIASLFLLENDNDKLLHYNGDVLVPVNNTLLLLLRIMLALSLVMGIVTTFTFIISALVGIFKKNVRQFSKKMFIFAVPFLLFVTFTVLLIANSTLDKLTILGNLSSVSITIFLCSTLFPLAAIGTTVWFFKNKELAQKKFTKVLFVFIISCNIFLSLYCMYYGWFAKMMWS